MTFHQILAFSRFFGNVKFAIFFKFSTIFTIKIEQKLDLKFDSLFKNIMISKRVYSFIRYLKVPE